MVMDCVRIHSQFGTHQVHHQLFYVSFLQACQKKLVFSSLNMSCPLSDLINLSSAKGTRAGSIAKINYYMKINKKSQINSLNVESQRVLSTPLPFCVFFCLINYCTAPNEQLHYTRSIILTSILTSKVLVHSQRYLKGVKIECLIFSTYFLQVLFLSGFQR